MGRRIKREALSTCLSSSPLFWRPPVTQPSCPNQMRAFGVQVDDTPTQFDSNSQHAIIASAENGDIITMPLSMQGIISFLPPTKPTLEELETCEQIVMTSDAIWDPGKARFGENEDALRHQKERRLSSSFRISRLELLSRPRNLSACSIATDPTDFINRLTILDRGDKVLRDRDLVTNIKSIQIDPKRKLY